MDFLEFLFIYFSMNFVLATIILVDYKFDDDTEVVPLLFLLWLLATPIVIFILPYGIASSFSKNKKVRKNP